MFDLMRATDRMWAPKQAAEKVAAGRPHVALASCQPLFSSKQSPMPVS
jgi:hypothetical protein